MSLARLVRRNGAFAGRSGVFLALKQKIEPLSLCDGPFSLG